MTRNLLLAVVLCASVAVVTIGRGIAHELVAPEGSLPESSFRFTLRLEQREIRLALWSNDMRLMTVRWMLWMPDQESDGDHGVPSSY